MTAIVAHAARRLDRPVRLVATRRQGFTLRTARAETRQLASGEKCEVLRSIGVQYIQGKLLARPGFRCLPAYELPHIELRQQVCA